MTPEAGRTHAVGHEQPSHFINAMSGAATQVSVVTIDGAAGRFGVTVSAFASVSAEPPLVLVCINSRSPSVAAIRENGRFCVNLLGEKQSALADCFAGRPGVFAPYDFACADWTTGVTGAPILDNPVASFDCMVQNIHREGSHFVVIGRVAQASASTRAPLAFSRRAYHSLILAQTKGRPA